MEHHSTAVLHEEHHVGGGTKEIWKVTIILSVLTIVELVLGFWMIGMPDGGLRWAIKGAIIILMMAKAFYIVGYFMHLRHEIRNLIMTIVVPLLLFVWFIIAFLYDGSSYNHMRRTYTPFYNDKSATKMEKKEGHSEGEHAEEPKEEHKPESLH
ncbi:cytochrome C oxidase subunit IV family protein [Panacibacter sp. DH6]|uniref:Cytochrome C oxidase subunit IV family protein n=1 Tax=Panacibacter microcysteis TaxID=2793269 RepID=A0A931E6H5_9BACT|nr:cytochrome C oxidase subunit IV family protein [Panacibacter microcysteis]MBG9375953.1 cytochrome C oxidase subunit IV family protein [Panacibacter microcysteis]